MISRVGLGPSSFRLWKKYSQEILTIGLVRNTCNSTNLWAQHSVSFLFPTHLPHTQLQGKGPGGPPPKSLRYSVNPNRVDNLDKFGKSIVAMCKGIPTYMAEEIQGQWLLYLALQVIAGGIVSY